MILLAMILAGVGAYVRSKQVVPVYEAETTLMVNEAPATQASEAFSTILTSQRLTKTYSEMLVKNLS